MGRKSLVEPGQRYERLIVVRKIAVKKWECLCDCGSTRIICSSSLLSGDTRSCGCYRGDQAKKHLNQLDGMRVGLLTVIRETDRINPLERRFECLCDCGNTTTVRYGELAQRRIKSCGCLLVAHQQRIKNYAVKSQNGLSGHPLFPTWTNMMSRCYKTSNKAYKNYGGRGIQVCSRWQSFENFIADMSPKPHGATIERINNNGDYEPDNCRWASSVEQNRNRRITSAIEFNGETKPLGEWCDLYKIPYKIVHARLYRCGWQLERALKTPVLTSSQAAKLQKS